MKSGLNRKRNENDLAVEFKDLAKMTDEGKAKLLLKILLCPNGKKIKLRSGLEFTPLNNSVTLFQFVAFIISLTVISFTAGYNPLNFENNSDQAIFLIGVGLLLFILAQVAFIYRVTRVVVYKVNNNISNEEL